MAKLSEYQAAEIAAAAAGVPRALRPIFVRRVASVLQGQTADDALVHAAIAGALQAMQPRRRDSVPLWHRRPRRYF
jgi:hypothetical protein